MYYKGLVDKYRKYLPVSDSTQIITLNEGNTPLIKADNLAKKIGLECDLYLKFEGCNPTGSFKDRGMTMAVTKAKESNSSAIICASTGNTSASAAAYGAKAGLKTYVLIPDGYIALGKLSQAMMSACLGEPRKTSEPNLAISLLEATVCIISIPQQEVAKVSGQRELARLQFNKKSIEDIITFIISTSIVFY